MALEVAIRGAALERSIERSQLLARAAEARLLRTQRRAAASIKSKASTRPALATEDNVRHLRLSLYVSLLQHVPMPPGLDIAAYGGRPARELSCIARAQDKERPGKPEDVVRLYDGMAAFAADLGDLAADVGGAAGEALIDRAAAQVCAVMMHGLSAEPMRTRAARGYRLHQSSTMWA